MTLTFVRYYLNNLTYGYSFMTKLILAVYLLKCVNEGLIISGGGQFIFQFNNSLHAFLPHAAHQLSHILVHIHMVFVKT